MLVERLKELGYIYEPAPLQVAEFHTAVRTGNLVFTSGQVSRLNDEVMKGLVGKDLDIPQAQRAAEICAYNCIRAVGAVADIDSIKRVIKVLGMVNVAPGFVQTPEVINGATSFLNKLFGPENTHARSAVGMTIPHDFAVEIEMVFELEG